LWKRFHFNHHHILDHSNAPYLRWLPKKNTSIHCHDLLAIRSAIFDDFGKSTGWTGTLLQRWIFSHLKNAQRILCGSNATRDDLLCFAKFQGELVYVDYPFHEDFHPIHEDTVNEWREKRGIPFPYLLHVGTNAWYKNREGILDLLNEIQREPSSKNLHIVFVGQSLTEELIEKANALGINDQIHSFSNVSNIDLVYFYNAAEALIFPSWAEGFGWPIVEAQACGCPVITSDREPMRQVSGGAALLVDPEHLGHSADSVITWLNSPLKSQQRSKGFESIQKHQPKMVLSRYLEIFELQAESSP
jgi:glycosyltransferase involved in cell wall biosynthesis